MLTRRRLLELIGGAGSAAMLAGCGGDDNGEPPATPTVTPPPEPTVRPTQEPITTPVAGYTTPAKWAGRTLVFAGRGGEYQVAQEEALFDPFALATGADIQIKIADVDRMREQVDQDSVSWDVLTYPMEDVLSLSRDGYLEPINYTVVDKTPLIPEIALQYGVGAAFFSTVIIYPPNSSNVPQSWVDFWDVPPFVEGEDRDPLTMRALRHTPVGTLEFALLADGVGTAELYPLDVERAFASLDRIRDHIAVWYEDGKQPVELVIAGQVGMASAWNVRPWQLGVENEVRMQWYGGMLSAEAWVVPKGAPNRDVAMDFINYATRAVPQANFGRLVPFGLVNPDAFSLLIKERADMLPSSPVNRSVQFVQNWNWWADNLEALTQRFNDWLLSSPDESSTPESE
ncbi:MAG: extracellular solute-binding protein [Thermomicrobiales bacterium]|nr:extracellular solute-binding protein [Thermomicrobiales bacterium]